MRSAKCEMEDVWVLVFSFKFSAFSLLPIPHLFPMKKKMMVMIMLITRHVTIGK